MQNLPADHPPISGAPQFSPAMATLFAAAFFLCLPSCEKPAYPIRHTFIDSDSGKALEVEITGRTQTQVEFIRLEDSKFFSYPIDKLSPEDRKFVERLRLEKTDSARIPRKKTAYVQTRLDHIAKLEQEITRLEREIQQEQNNPGMRRHHQRQMADKGAEIEKLKKDIEQHRLGQ